MPNSSNLNSIINLDSTRATDSHSGVEISVLAVDDQMANLIALKAALKGCDYRLVTVSSGEEALLQVEENEFAAILMDVQMPNLNGFETASRIRQSAKAKHTPIIFLTAIYHDEHYVTKGYEAGAVDYIYKPLNVPMLKAKLEVFAELHRQRKEIEYQSELRKKFESQVHENKMAELKKNTQRQYQDLVEGIRNGIVWCTDVDTLKFTFVSSHAETILGFPISSWFKGKSFAINLIHEDDRHNVQKALDLARTEGIEVDLEHRMVGANGEVLWFQSNVRVAETANGKEFRGLSFDVTKLKNTENSLRDMLQVRDEFLSIASHELKTPLTPLQLQVEGFLRLFNQGRIKDVPEQVLKQMLETSGSQVAILSKLVDQLLDVSRISSGKIKLDLEPTDLVACVRDIAGLFREQLAEQNIPLIISHPKELTGNWDRLRIEQIVMNLVNNAIKYGAGKAVNIEIFKEGEVAVLKVRDNGIGIPKSDQHRIFGRFERAVSANSFSGLGLGLYITHEIVEIHQGKISVQSDLGQGAEFRVELPIAGPKIKSLLN
ncbi:MAG: ATP-binding protein [Bdellovibrionota bacterium]